MRGNQRRTAERVAAARLQEPMVAYPTTPAGVNRSGGRWCGNSSVVSGDAACDGMRDQRPGVSGKAIGYEHVVQHAMVGGGQARSYRRRR